MENFSNFNYRYCYNYLDKYKNEHSELEITLLIIDNDKKKELIINSNKYYLLQNSIVFKNNMIKLLEINNDNIIIYYSPFNKSEFFKLILTWNSIDSFRIFRKDIKNNMKSKL